MGRHINTQRFPINHRIYYRLNSRKKPNTIKKKLSVDLHRKVNHQLPDTDRFVISSRDLDLIIIALGRVLSNHLLVRGVATRFTPPLRRRGYYPPDRIGATPVGIISTIQCLPQMAMLSPQITEGIHTVP